MGLEADARDPGLSWHSPSLWDWGCKPAHFSGSALVSSPKYLAVAKGRVPPLKGLDIPGREPSCPGTDTIPYLGFVTVLLRNR